MKCFAANSIVISSTTELFFLAFFRWASVTYWVPLTENDQNFQDGDVLLW